MMTSSSCWVVCVAVLAMAALVSSTHVQPIQDSEVAEVPERLRELLLIRRLISSLSGVEALPPAQPAIRDSSLDQEVAQLARASAANMDLRSVRVSKRALQAYCSSSGDRQCRGLCFNLGDPSCAEGDIGGNGEDAFFLAGGNTPGK
ncbi:uncharacterized protein [Panulirus ornatus]|uniref:uncharacterized protein n=1 Tax=Panulirus ornatus TaxID=150431 RepID=UPI003A868BD4